MSARIEFPQPEVEAPTVSSLCYYLTGGNQVWESMWDGSAYDLTVLAARNLYLTHDACEQRIKWNAQQMARLVIPAWFRDMGDAIQWKRHNGTWSDLIGGAAGLNPNDWGALDPANYRAAPRDVVVNVNGVEYRWPPTAKQGDPIGARFVVLINHILVHTDSTAYGPSVHRTRAGAEQQLAAINNAAGVLV